MKFSPNLSLIKYSLLLLLILSQLVLGQTNPRIKLAQTLERSGNFTDALQIYMDLYNSADHSHQVINGISNSYNQLGRFDDLTRFYEQLLKAHPGQVHHKVSLGKAYYLNSQGEKAKQIWNNLLKQYPQNTMLYRRTASAMIELRLYEDAIAVYRMALDRLNKEYIFYRDIALLYRAQFDYKQAVDYLIKYYRRAKKQYPYIRSQFLSMARDSEATNDLIDILNELNKQENFDDQLEELRAELFIKKKDFAAAYSIYQQLDEKSEQTSIVYLQRFAVEAERNNAFDFAVRSYRLILEQNLAPTTRENLRLSLARNLFRFAKEKKGEFGNDEIVSYVKESEQIIDNIIRLNKDHIITRKAIEYKAHIYEEYYQDLDQAAALYLDLIKLGGKVQETERIYLEIARISLLKNDLEKAKTYYQKVNRTRFKNIAHYNLAELEYYSGNFLAAKMKFEQVLKAIKSADSLSNNILDRLVVIEQFLTDSTALAQYARAELLVRQKRFVQSAEIFEELANEKSSLKFRASLRAASNFQLLGELDHSALILQNIINENANHPDIDQAYFALADLKSQQGAFDQAAELYRTIMIEYPNSFYSETAREKARFLTSQKKQVN